MAGRLHLDAALPDPALVVPAAQADQLGGRGLFNTGGRSARAGARGAQGPVIHDVSGAAALGITRGARVTDMRTLVPHLRVEDADPDTDAADLERLAAWARRWYPCTQVEGEDTLLVASGSDHLHGSEDRMARDMVAAFTRAGLTAHVAATPSIGAARALAHHGGKRQIVCPSDSVADRLAPLPTSALRLDSDTDFLLRQLGIKTIGALAALPSDALGRRFRRIEV